MLRADYFNLKLMKSLEIQSCIIVKLREMKEKNFRTCFTANNSK